MRVVFGSSFQESMGGGVGQVAHEISHVFAKEGHRVLFIIPGRSTRFRFTDNNFSSLQVKSFGEKDILIPQLNLVSMRFVLKNLERFSPEIIHLHDPGPISFLLQSWAMENHVPVILTSHLLPSKLIDFGGKEAVRSLGSLWDTGILKKFLFSFYQNCEGVIALNKIAEEDLRDFGYSGKIFLIPNGRNLSLYDQKPLPDILQKEKKLIFVGFISERKNQHFLLEVMRKLPKNYSLTLVGDYLSRKYLKKLEKYVQRYHLNKVKFTGKVPYEKISQYLAESHVFVSASTMEVQSLAVIEALAAGKPIVGFSNETIDEFIDDSVGYNFSIKTSPSDFAKKIENICSQSKNDYEKMCRLARKRVSRLDWEDIVPQTLEAYKILEESARQEKGKAKRDKKDFLEKLERFFDFEEKDSLKSNKKRFSTDLFLFLAVIFTSLGAGFYGLYHLPKILPKTIKNTPKYLSKIVKRFMDFT